MRKILSALALAGTLAVGNVALTPDAAEAATVGCIGDYKWRYSHTERWTRLKVFNETCDYRTSLGVIIQDVKTGNVWKTW